MRCDAGFKSKHWTIEHAHGWAEVFILKVAVNERGARLAYREDHGMKRLPKGTKFYPGVLI